MATKHQNQDTNLADFLTSINSSKSTMNQFGPVANSTPNGLPTAPIVYANGPATVAPVATVVKPANVPVAKPKATISGTTPVVTTPINTPTPIVETTKTSLPAPGSVASLYMQSPEEITRQKEIAGLVEQNRVAANQVLSPEEEYQNQLKQYQAQINSINSMYSDRINAARIQGQGRIESRQFAQGRQGQIGSGVGEANINAVQNANTEVVNSIQDEQNAAVQSVYAKVRSGASDSLAAKTLAKQQGADKLLEYLNNVPGETKKKTSSAVAELLAKGVDISNMTQEQIDSYVKGLGITQDTLASEFKTQGDIAKKQKIEDEKKAAEALKVKAETDKIVADVANWGRLTEYQKGQLKQTGIRDAQSYEVAKMKAGDEKDKNNYDAKTIPVEVKSTLLEDVKSADSVEELMAAYPGVNSTYITDLFDQLN